MKIITNKKALHDYDVLDEFTAGLVLIGNEIKALRRHECNISGTFCSFDSGELFMRGSYFAPSRCDHLSANSTGYRDRKLLLTKKELRKLEAAVKDKGITIVPLHIDIINNMAKCVIGICRGKHDYDKREDIRRRDAEREMRADT